jgi:hypothetical protein
VSDALTRSQRARAARVFAEANAPFVQSGLLVLENKSGASIWYWDEARLAEFGLGSVRPVSPETVWRPTGDGWRIIACLEGFEAQYWLGGALLASNWRRTEHTAEQWRGFVLSVEGAEHEAPDEPPTPALTDLTDTSWRRAQVRKPLGWRDAELGAWTIAVCMAALALFLAGQALRYGMETRHFEKRSAALEARVASDEDTARSRAFVQTMSDFRAATDGGGALRAMTEAFATLSRFGVEASQWSFDGERFSMLIDDVTGRPVRDIVSAMERSPTLCAVTPEITSDGVSLSGGIERDGLCRVTEPEPGA